MFACCRRLARVTLVGIVALGAAGAAVAIVSAQDAKTPPAGGEVQLPPGWTMEDMMAFAEAGTPGEMHAFLAKGAGTWDAKVMMWMAPDAEPMTSEGRSVVTPIMDGRYVQVEMTGEMPGMGQYRGLGLYGFDNAASEFQATWIDNHSTSMMRGVGTLNSSRDEMTWRFTHTCPLREGPTTMREVERITGENSKTLEMWGSDPKSGKEFRMMKIEFTRQNSAPTRTR